MTTETQDNDTQVVETWEIQVPSTCRILKVNRRTGLYEQVRVSGTKGPKVIQITRDERLYNQERIDPEMAKFDPFQNGTLARREGDQLVGITKEDLEEMLQVLGDDFDDLVKTITNELTARRLLDMAMKVGRMDQVNSLRDHIDDNWRVGGTQPSVGDMMQESESGERVT